MFIIISLCLMLRAQAQKDAIVLEVGESKTSLDEFTYLYDKNSLDSTQKWTLRSLRDYAERYADFRLKIEEAKRQGLDTTEAFQDEFRGYKDQLNESYLTDKKVTERLIREAYERLQEDIRATHILLKVAENAPPADTLSIYRRMQRIRQEALDGANFDSLVRKYSEDQSVKVNGGDLGYFTALRMVYPFENAAYATPEGEVSEIVRTQYGYHILKVTDRRPNRGTVQFAHIFVSKDSADAEERIRKIYNRLQEGADWDAQCKQFSDDTNSASRGGILTPFQSSGYSPGLENLIATAFKLQEKGTLSEPVPSAFGWHIVKLIQKEPLGTLDKLSPRLKRRIERDSRAKVRQRLFYDRLREENNYRKSKNYEAMLAKAIDSTLLRGQWSYTRMNNDLNKPLFFIDQEEFKLRGFLRYLEREQRPQPKGTALMLYVEDLYQEYLDEKLLDYEKQHLAEKYPEYAFLSKEYYEGILFFEIMNQNVWRKAMTDQPGLQAFFEQHRNDYQWAERAETVVYTLSEGTDRETFLRDLDALDEKALLAKYNTEDALTLSIQRGKYEKEGFPVKLEEVEWKPGRYLIKDVPPVQVVEIKELLPPQPKALEEVRGAVVSDYQKKLEADWLERLRERYTVQINEKLLKTLVKSE